MLKQFPRLLSDAGFGWLGREAKDASGATPLDAAMCKGRIGDEELFMMLSSDAR